MKNSRKRTLLVFDQAVATNSPAGSCVLEEVKALGKRNSIKVFSEKFDGEASDAIQFFKVWLPKGPLIARYVIFQLFALFVFLVWRLRNRSEEIYIQTTQGQFIWADISYAHFCHHAYLSGPWKLSPVRGSRRLARYMVHRFCAFTEALTFRGCKKIVVPSVGLAEEIRLSYPGTADKLHVVPNPVDLKKYKRPLKFDRIGEREKINLGANDVVCVFIALGDFSRKGLGLIFEAAKQLETSRRETFRILVVGGSTGEIKHFRSISGKLGISESIQFVGLQSDIRPYLWMADLIACPSAYETFSLVVFQAAAAGLPALISPEMYGARDLITDGRNGYVEERSAAGVLRGIERFYSARSRWDELSKEAISSVCTYSTSHFAEKWLAVYEGV